VAGRGFRGRPAIPVPTDTRNWGGVASWTSGHARPNAVTVGTARPPTAAPDAKHGEPLSAIQSNQVQIPRKTNAVGFLQPAYHQQKQSSYLE